MQVSLSLPRSPAFPYLLTLLHRLNKELQYTAINRTIKELRGLLYNARQVFI